MVAPIYPNNTEEPMKNVSKFILLALMIAVLSACGGVKDKYSQVTVQDGKVIIPTASVSDGEAHYFKIETAGKEIKFFLVKSSDGIIRAAFDACDVCYKEKKGYSQEGQFMVCNNCGQKFHTSRINVVKGGCNPSPLKRANAGENIVITLADIQSGTMYF